MRSKGTLDFNTLLHAPADVIFGSNKRDEILKWKSKPVQKEFVWPPTVEQDAYFTQYLYISYNKKSLPVFKEICLDWAFVSFDKDITWVRLAISLKEYILRYT